MVKEYFLQKNDYKARILMRITKQINIPPDSPASHLLQRVRDEAHRFAQGYFHVLQSKAGQQSRLDEISGVGPKTKKILLRKFGSLAGIRQAEKDDIIKLVGRAKTERLLENI